MMVRLGVLFIIIPVFWFLGWVPSRCLYFSIPVASYSRDGSEGEKKLLSKP